MPLCLYCQAYKKFHIYHSGWIVIHSPAGKVYVCPKCAKERGLVKKDEKLQERL